MTPLARVAFPDGAAVPALGLGTWRMGERAKAAREEVAAVRLALDLGMTLIDTAEMYGEGGAEEVVGEALAGAIADGVVQRADVFVVTKVYPHNASERGVAQACDRSRRRLRLDVIDLYLLHWRGRHPLAATVAGFESLRARGAIGRWGVSNFDVADLEELRHTGQGARCVANQVYYSASQRGIEFDLLPRQRGLGIATMAYCPIDQGRLSERPELGQLAARHGVGAAQLALAWVLRQPDVIAIPKAVREKHLSDNLAAATLTLGEDDLVGIDRLFPPPRGKRPLMMT
jgi:diketogulonate reductase-like aldo/keto reductase